MNGIAVSIIKFFKWLLNLWRNRHPAEEPEKPYIEPDWVTWVANQVYIPRNLIPIVVRGIVDTDLDKDTDIWFNESVKSLIEVHSLKINGFHSGFNISHIVESASINYHQELPSFVWQEKYGKPINCLFHFWAELCEKIYKESILDQKSRHANPTMDLEWINENIHRFTIDVMFIEPDPTHTKVIDAWLVTEMYPQLYSGSEAKREVESQRDDVKYKVSFHGNKHKGEDINKQAQELLDRLNVTGGSDNAKFVTDIGTTKPVQV